jgi:SAM-dependent methyltransferase
MNAAEDFLIGYFRLMGYNGAAHVYRVANSAGIVRELLASRLTAAELAHRCNLQVRPTQLLLESLAAIGVVTLADDKFALSALGQMLVGGSYRQLGDEYWAHLPAFLASGKPIVKMDDSAQSEAHYQSQAAILGWMLTPAAQCAAAILRGMLPRNAAILDLGAGSAVWSLMLAKEVDGATVTAVDWPAVLEVAKETAEQLRLADRLATIAGNYHEVELPHECFDLAILANVTHLETPEGNRDLLTKAHAALKLGGRISIVDVFPGQPQGDLNRTLYTLGLALRTEQGKVYSAEELGEILTAVGFAPPQVMPLDVPPNVLGILVAMR